MVNNINSKDRIVQLQVELEAEQSSNYSCFQKTYVLKKILAEAYKEEKALWSQRG